MTFTKKQQAALSRAPPQQRAAMKANFALQDKKTPKNKETNKEPSQRVNRWTRNRANALQTFAQGAAAVPKIAFGGRDKHDLSCWNALSPNHLSLPRSVGPYTVIRTTKRISSNRVCMLFGSFRHETNSSVTSGANDWTNIAALGDVNGLLAIGGTTNCERWCYDMSAFGAAATCVPAALSVQVVNPEALTSTTGVVYAGVMSTQAAWGGSGSTWTTTYDRFIQFQAPRMMMAGKLALRGVHINSYPLNMNAISDFDGIDELVDGNQTWSANLLDPVGLAPILVYNTQGIQLEYLVTMEWRVRFDLANPASSSHTHHPVASDATWDHLMKQAVSLGHGVRDIAEVVANTGQFADAASAMFAL